MGPGVTDAAGSMVEDEVSEDTRTETPSPASSVEGGLMGLFGSFPKTFWVVNAFELFERGAYYGAMSIMALHVINNILAGNAYADAIWGALYALMVISMYFVPLTAGALAEKYGYKKVLAFAFGMMTLGYFLLFTVRPGQLSYLIVVLVILSVGAGAFKPIISASVAHVTTEEQRNQAYSIYYWMINLGASVMPFILGAAFPVEALWYYVFLVSGALMLCNWVIFFTLFRDPSTPNPTLSVPNALRRIIPALQNRQFAVLLFIYAGFWFMFAYNHTFLQRYMFQFGRMPADFPPQWINVVNPATIIAVGPFLGKAVERFKSLNVMMLGIIVFCVGLAINGLSDSQGLFILGIVIFSIGEFIVHPGFISYVSKIAPKDMVAIYMAAIFLSTGLGQILGGVIGGFWYNWFATFLLRPKFFIGLVISVGILTLVAFMWYNKWTIRLMMKEDPSKKMERNVWTHPVTPLVAILFIPILLGGTWAAGTSPLAEEQEGPSEFTDWSDYDIVTGSQSFSDYAAENGASDTVLTMNEVNVIEVTFTLTWTDEADFSPRHNNQPDEFALEVFAPDGRDLDADYRSNPSGGSGQVSITVDFEPDKDPYENGTGEWTVTVLCGQCGDQTLWRPSAGIFDQPDNGNDWDLAVSYRYYEKPGQAA